MPVPASTEWRDSANTESQLSGINLKQFGLRNTRQQSQHLFTAAIGLFHSLTHLAWLQCTQSAPLLRYEFTKEEPPATVCRIKWPRSSDSIRRRLNFTRTRVLKTRAAWISLGRVYSSREFESSRSTLCPSLAESQVAVEYRRSRKKSPFCRDPIAIYV